MAGTAGRGRDAWKMVVILLELYKSGVVLDVHLCTIMSFDAFGLALLIWVVACPVLGVVVVLLGALIRDLSALVTIYSDVLAAGAVVCGVYQTVLRQRQRAALAAQVAAAAVQAATQAAWNEAQAAESEDTDDNEDWSEGE